LNMLWERINENEATAEQLEDKVVTLKTKGQNTDEILKFIETPVDVALSMFSLSFFYKSEKTLDALVETFDKAVASNGTVIVNFMDGDRVGEMLKSKTIDNNLYKIKLGHKNKK